MSELLTVGANPSTSNWTMTSATTDSNNVLNTTYILKMSKDEDEELLLPVQICRV